MNLSLIWVSSIILVLFLSVVARHLETVMSSCCLCFLSFSFTNLSEFSYYFIVKIRSLMISCQASGNFSVFLYMGNNYYVIVSWMSSHLFWKSLLWLHGLNRWSLLGLLLKWCFVLGGLLSCSQIFPLSKLITIIGSVPLLRENFSGPELHTVTAIH